MLEKGNVPDSGADLALRLGFDVLQNLKSARDALHTAAQQLRQLNALSRAPHTYQVGDAVLL